MKANLAILTDFKTNGKFELNRFVESKHFQLNFIFIFLLGENSIVLIISIVLLK